MSCLATVWVTSSSLSARISFHNSKSSPTRSESALLEMSCDHCDTVTGRGGADLIRASSD